MQDDEFRPRLGKIGSRGSQVGKRYAGQVRAAINRAGGRQGRGGRFIGSRIGRGGAAAAVLR
ncbi:hypothetical protein EOD23_36975, partial [Mesorhizobium sp. USDA-HM6]